MHLRTKCVIGLVAMLMASGVLSDALAQGANLVFVYEITPRNGRGPAFASAIQDHLAVGEAQRGAWTWQVCEVGIGDDIATCIVRSGGWISTGLHGRPPR
ncbi:MAG: hypothetical protein OSA81_10705 [Longimicrobiales bacterium]|nr:hypothetical protein [Longimicrobiales bacterium]